MFFAVIGVIGASVENIATEIRHLQRSEVREVEEFLTQGKDRRPYHFASIQYCRKSGIAVDALRVTPCHRCGMNAIFRILRSNV